MLYIVCCLSFLFSERVTVTHTMRRVKTPPHQWRSVIPSAGWLLYQIANRNDLIEFVVALRFASATSCQSNDARHQRVQFSTVQNHSDRVISLWHNNFEYKNCNLLFVTTLQTNVCVCVRCILISLFYVV